MTNKEAIKFFNTLYTFHKVAATEEDLDEICIMVIQALEQEPKTDYKSFAEWVASEIFSDNWEYNKNSFAEIACRKLEKLGIVAREDDIWKLRESEE